MNAREKFAPLSPEEMAGASTINAPAPEEGEIVVPVPLDAPLLGVKFRGRKPDEVFWFLNEKGERLFAECRWNLERRRQGGQTRLLHRIMGGSSLLILRRARSTTSTSSPLRQTVPCGCSRGRARQTRAERAFRAP